MIFIFNLNDKNSKCKNVSFRNKLHFFEEFLNSWMEKFRGDNSTSAVSIRLHQDITSYLVSIFI